MLEDCSYPRSVETLTIDIEFFVNKFSSDNKRS